jgi:hypothetical protein
VRVSVHQGGVPAAKATGLMTHCEWVKPMAAEQVYPRLNHPVILLYDSAEGELKGIVIGEITCAELPDNIAVTGLRTAATSAVGTDLLARPDASSIGIFGAAGQAKNHLLAMMQVRKLKSVKVYSRNPENRRKFAEEMGPLTNLNITPVSSPETAVRGVDIILTATNQRAGVRRQLARTRAACNHHRRQQRRPGQGRLRRRQTARDRRRHARAVMSTASSDSTGDSGRTGRYLRPRKPRRH